MSSLKTMFQNYFSQHRATYIIIMARVEFGQPVMLLA